VLAATPPEVVFGDQKNLGGDDLQVVCRVVIAPNKKTLDFYSRMRGDMTWHGQNQRFMTLQLITSAER